MKTLRAILGIETTPVRHLERLLATLGGFFGIFAILLVSNYFLPPASAAMIVASMGASAVLLFAVPNGPLSQPWAVFCGHIISAFIGVSCAKWIPDQFLAAAVAVGLAIGAMHYLRAIHPPGGATALTAVAGGSAIHDLGYQFMLTPVLLNVLVILLIAVMFNAPFPWRRYPAWFKKKGEEKNPYDNISHGDLVYALSELNTYVDISEEDLLRIYNLATMRSIDATHLHLSQIHLWGYYSNGANGEKWTIRQLVDEDDDGTNIIFKTIVGPNSRSTGHVARKEFADWAEYEVELTDGDWHRVVH